MPYKPDGFVPVGNYAFDVTAVVVRGDAPWRNLAELNAYAREHPGRLSYGSAGSGTLSALNMELLKDAFGLDIVHVSYPGAPQVTNALLGRQLEIGAVPLSSAASLLRDGSLRAVATTAQHRPPSFPDIPTLAESGYGRASLALAIGLYAPAGTHQVVIDILSRALRRTVGTASVIAALEHAGLAVHYEDRVRVQERLAAEKREVMDLGRKLRTSSRSTKGRSNSRDDAPPVASMP